MEARRYLIVLLLMVSLSLSVYAAGETCTKSEDCPQGYCADGACIIPNVSDVSDWRVEGTCITTADCHYGYCVSGECIVPLAGLAKNNFGLKSGCAGLIDCTSGLTCLILCNFIWLLIVILAALAGYSTRKRENKVVPIVLVILPLLIALLTYPVIALIEAFLQLIYISAVKRIKKQEEEEE